VADDPNELIPPDVLALIAGLDSVAQLEILLLLHREPSRQWTAEQVAGELRINPAAAAEQMNVLCDRQLLACDGGRSKQYHDAAHTPQVAAAIDQLTRLYNERRVTVITLVFTKPSDPLRSFADAFKIRRRDTRDG